MALIGVTGGETWPPVTKQGGKGVKQYTVEINGMETTLLLSDEDAKERGLKPSDVVKPEADEPEAKGRTPANKARTPANKRADTASKAWGAKKT
jgi:hypothetical protein